jgi:hypothetical protein
LYLILLFAEGLQFKGEEADLILSDHAVKRNIKLLSSSSTAAMMPPQQSATGSDMFFR